MTDPVRPVEPERPEPAPEGVGAAVPGATAPEPGWYVAADGVVRWWTGGQWDLGVVAPPGFGATGAAGVAAAPTSPGAVGYDPPGYAAPAPGPAPYGAAPYGAAPYGAAPYSAAPYGPRPPNTTLALLAHLGPFVGGFVLPLVLYLTSGRDDPFVRWHAAESLNFQLTYLVVVFGGVLLGIVTVGFGLLLVFPLIMVFAVLMIIWSIMGALAASRGEWWRYPVNIRFVKFA